MFNLFGFQFGKAGTPTADTDPTKLKSFIAPDKDDGAINIEAGGVYSSYIDLSSEVRSEFELITRYREMSRQHECDKAISNIINEAIVVEEKKPPVSIDLEKLENTPESIKKKIKDEFDVVLKLLDFNNQSYNIFKKWYVDGRLYYHVLVDEEKPKLGIQEIRYIDPRQIRKIREIKRGKDPKTGADIISEIKEYYIYNHAGVAPTGGTSGGIGTAIEVDAIAFVHSGEMNSQRTMILSFLDKAVRPLNLLRMTEDAMVIYRAGRATERKVFYIDTGQMAKPKAEQYVRGLMAKYKNNMVYNATTGTIQDNRRVLSMLEDIWIPRADGSTTQIDTLSGAQNLGETGDTEYFKRQLYEALNVPLSRMTSDNGSFNNKDSEITQDERAFNRFVIRLRNRFSHIFDELLRKQLILKNIIKQDEWDEIKEGIYYDFLSDSYYAEQQDVAILKDRVDTLNSMLMTVGVYYSKAWVRKNVLKQSEEEIEEIDKEIAEEAEIANAELAAKTEAEFGTRERLKAQYSPED